MPTWHFCPLSSKCLHLWTFELRSGGWRGSLVIVSFVQFPWRAVGIDASPPKGVWGFLQTRQLWTTVLTFPNLSSQLDTFTRLSWQLFLVKFFDKSLHFCRKPWWTGTYYYYWHYVYVIPTAVTNRVTLTLTYVSTIIDCGHDGRLVFSRGYCQVQLLFVNISNVGRNGILPSLIQQVVKIAGGGGSRYALPYWWGKLT